MVEAAKAAKADIISGKPKVADYTVANTCTWPASGLHVACK